MTSVDTRVDQAVVRVGVVGPTGRLVACALTGAGEGGRLQATALEEVSRAEADGVDVVLVVTAWLAERPAGPRSVPADLMEALEGAAAAGDVPIVLFGEQSSDPEFVIEAMAHPSVVGRVPAAIEPAVLREVLTDVARGTAHPALVTDESRTGLHTLLERSRLLARLSCAVAGQGATTWTEIARCTGFSVRTVQGSPARFAPLIRRDLGLAANHDVTQALLFHWLGAKAAYVRSWCRRQGGPARFD